MKRLGDILVGKDRFEEILMGNEAVVRAMVESGTKVVSSYPGSPTPEIAAAITSIPETKRPFYFEFSVNEKVASEVAMGAAVNGNLSCVFFKSVGLNVALDSFVQFSLMNIIGGLVVVVGDDPGANSSQNEQDNRNVYKMAKVTVFEPASPQEAYAYYLKAAQLAVQEQTVVVLRLTTHVCHARQKVEFGAFDGKDKPFCSDFNAENGPYIALTSMALDMKRKAMNKLHRSAAFIRQQGLNTVSHFKDNKKRGVITSGLSYLSVLDAYEQASFRPDILKLGVTNPLENESIIYFLKNYYKVLIIEELDDIIELQVKAIAYDHGLKTQIFGKTKDEDFIGEYTPDKTRAKLVSIWPDMMDQPHMPVKQPFEIPPRPAQMCPGCGHRSAFFAIKQALASDDVTVADIGCHTLGHMPPYNVGEILLCMGASTGLASGLSLSKAKRVVAFLGDSTFFHAGLPGIINAVFNRHDITLIIMENGTTAMTGHQDHAGESMAIESVLKGFGVENIQTCDTYSQAKLTEIVRQSMMVKGLSVVIAKHPCMLKFTRIQRKNKHYVKRHISIEQEICNQTHDCIARFGCPTFVRNQDDKVEINLDLCIGDGSCRLSCPQQALGYNRGAK